MAQKKARLKKTVKQNGKVKRPKTAGERSGNIRPIDSKEVIIEYKVLLQALDHAALVSMTDAKGSIIYANDKFVEVSKYPLKMLLGQNHRILKSNLQPQSIYEDLWNTISSGRTWRGELNNRAKDGSLYWVDSTISPILGDDGKPQRYIAIRFLITDRKAIESKVKEASGYARSLIETSLDPLVTISVEGKITDVNEASMRVTGNSRADLIGTDFSDYFTHPDQARTGYKQAFEKGSVTDYPLTIRHKTGKLTDVLYNASVYKDMNGNVLGVFAAARDVTAQKQASQYARSLVEASLDPLVTISPEGKITDVNEATIKVTGSSREDLIGSDFSNYFTEPEKAREGYQQVFAKGSVTDFPLTIRHKARKLTDVLYNASVYKDMNGNVLGVFAAARDVTAQKQAEYQRGGQIALSEKMRGEQSISRLGQSILGHLVPFSNAQIGAFYLVTDNKKLQMMSSYALTKLQASKKFVEFGEGLVGQVAIDKKSLLVDDIPSCYFNKIESALGALVPRSLLIFPIFYENEVVGVIELGSLHAFTEHQIIFLTSVSENIGIAINTSDVRKKVEIQNEALNNTQVLLKEKAIEVQLASRHKTEFLANMSHEIRTPVGAILGFTDLMKNRTNTAEENQNYMAVVDRNSQHLLRLIDDILDLSKVEAGMMTVESIQFSLAEMLADFTSLMRFRSEEKGIKFQFTGDSLFPDYICSDPVRLRQILTNIVGNAIKFTDKGTIDFRVAFENPILKFTVKDTGLGISKDQVSRLFQPFTQADTSTTRKFGGTGLGLVLAKRLSERLGGRLELLESKEGYGSTFVIEIKSILHPNTKFVGQDVLTVVAAQQIDSNQKSQALRGLNVLLVEDSPDNKILISIYLNKEGAHVKTAGDGAGGVELALSENFDVILMDIQMPILDGHEAVKKLRLLGYTKPIIALTAHAMNEEREKCFESGFTDFLTKPIQLNSMIEVLARYVPRRIEDKTPAVITSQ